MAGQQHLSAVDTSRDRPGSSAGNKQLEASSGSTPCKTKPDKSEAVSLQCFQEEFSLALTEMRTADPGDVILTLKNPKVEGSSLAKRRKTKAEQEPVGEKSGENEKVVVKVVSKDSGVDIKEAAPADHDLGGEESKMGTKEDNLINEDTEEIISSREEVFKKGEKRVNQDILKGREEKTRMGEKASSQDSIESRASSDSGQDFA